jgi:hypothetical protein
MKVITQKGSVAEEDTEVIDIIGAKPRILFKKKTDSTHFIEIIAEDDSYVVRSGGKDYRRGADGNPLYASLIDDGFNLLRVLLHDFALRDRVQESARDGQKKNYALSSGPVAGDAPFAQALLAKMPAFKEIVGGEVTGGFVVDQTNLPQSGNISLSMMGKEGHSIALTASFSLALSPSGESIAMPTLPDEEPTQNYPVDIARRFNELMEGK